MSIWRCVCVHACAHTHVFVCVRVCCACVCGEGGQWLSVNEGCEQGSLWLTPTLTVVVLCVVAVLAAHTQLASSISMQPV